MSMKYKEGLQDLMMMPEGRGMQTDLAHGRKEEKTCGRVFAERMMALVVPCLGKKGLVSVGQEIREGERQTGYLPTWVEK